jgi:hypothetical protein
MCDLTIEFQVKMAHDKDYILSLTLWTILLITGRLWRKKAKIAYVVIYIYGTQIKAP